MKIAQRENVSCMVSVDEAAAVSWYVHILSNHLFAFILLMHFQTYSSLSGLSLNHAAHLDEGMP